MNLKRKVLILVGISIVFILSSCVPHKAYRDNIAIKRCLNDQCADALIEEHSGPGGHYDLAFVEFTERGNLFDRAKFDRVLQHIEKKKQESGITVLVYVHGWKHNASNMQDGDVHKFRKLLKIVDEKKVGKRKTMGVYIGWRGLASDYEPARTLSYWSRKNAAHQIGSGGVSEVLLRLEKLIKKDGQGTAPNQHIFAVAGHSFGAAVILSAAKDILLDRIVNARLVADRFCEYPERYTYSCAGQCYQTPRFGDGIILLNPAIEANELMQIKESVSEQRCYSNRQSKLLSILSADSDWPNKTAFITGQVLGVSLRNYEEKLPRKLFKNNGDEKRDAIIKEHHLNTRTIGHYAPFRTELRKDDKDKATVVSTACEGSGECVDDEGNPELTRRNFPVSPNEPVSITYHESEFLKDHGDIFNAPVISFIASSVIENQFAHHKHLNPEQGDLRPCFKQVGAGEEHLKFSKQDCENFFMGRYKKGFEREFPRTQPEQ